MPSGSYLQRYVQCPFYQFDVPKRKLLACEGITEAELPTKRQFRREDGLREYMLGYCCESYEYCEYYRMLMEYKYPDNE